MLSMDRQRKPTVIPLSILDLAPVTEGKVLFDGVDVAGLQGEKLRAARQDMQMVFQDPLSSLDPRQSIESLLLEGMHATERWDNQPAVGVTIADLDHALTLL